MNSQILLAPPPRRELNSRGHNDAKGKQLLLVVAFFVEVIRSVLFYLA